MAVRVEREPFDISREIANLTVSRTDIGAVVTFTGKVRGSSASGPIREMSLEHYPGMTEAELASIETEAKSRWNLNASLIIHRYGPLQPGDDIVLVVTASSHRQDAFEAAQFLMDFLKTKAPFWKKETSEDGEGQWVDARDCDDKALERWQK